jgi:hypothetical protein
MKLQSYQGLHTRFDSFASALFPESEENELEVLKQGGIPSSEVALTDELRELLDETLDFVDSSDFAAVESAILENLFRTFFSALEPSFCDPATPDALVDSAELNGRSFLHPRLQRITEVVDKTTKLATLLPAVAKQSHLIFHGLPNEYIDVSEASQKCYYAVAIPDG